MDENIPVDIEQFYNTPDVEIKDNDKEASNLYNLYHSQGWELVKNYIDSVKVAINQASKQKDPVESLESYGAKRMSADAISDTLDNLINFVQSAAENYRD